MTQPATVQTEKKLVRAVGTELIKPLEEIIGKEHRELDWKRLGTTLHTQRKVMGQLLQAGVDAIVACNLVGTDVVKEVIAPDVRAKTPDGLAYQAIKRELDKIRQHPSWNDEQRAALDINPATLASLSDRAAKDYAAWRSAQYDKKRHGHGKRGRASYGKAQPIAIRQDSWSIDKTPKGYVLELELFEGKPKSAFRVALAPSKNWHWKMMGKLERGEIERGDCKLVYSERRKKWFAKLAVKEPVPSMPPECDPNNILVVHRGKHNLVTVLSSTGHWLRLAKGFKLLNLKRKFERRRREVKQVAEAERGRGASGHGSPRRYELPDALREKENRAIHTLLQQLNAKTAKVARAWGCGTILCEDYGGIEPSDDEAERRFVTHFPNHQHKLGLEWMAKKNGFIFATVPAEYISSICPRCGNKDVRQHNHRGTFHCSNPPCSISREADFVAPLHMLRRFLGHGGEWDRLLRIEKQLEDDLNRARDGVEPDATAPQQPNKPAKGPKRKRPRKKS